MHQRRRALIVVALAFLLLLTSAAPSFGQEKERRDTWVRMHPVPSSESTQSTDATMAVAAVPPTDLNSCAATAGPSVFSSRTRFYMCSSWKPAWLWQEGYTGGPIIGEIRGRLTFFSVADRLSRKVTTTVMIDQVVLSGTGNNASMGTRVTCTGLACSWPSQDTMQFAFNWANGNYRSFTYSITNTGSGGAGAELKKFATLSAAYKVASEANPTPLVNTWATNHKPRCDSAAYITGSGGCVFYIFIPVFTLSISGDGVPEAADHYRDAIEQPQSTIPSVANKSIPSLLHRTRNQSVINANTAAALNTCNTDPAFQNVNKTGKNCDEYPFASTAEGASTGPQHYSVRWINGSQNQLAGSKLASFYGFNRVLDGDDFKVAISD